MWVGAFSVIVKTDGSFAALYETVPSFLPAKCGVGVGIPSVVQCPVCTVYSAYNTVQCRCSYELGCLHTLQQSVSARLPWGSHHVVCYNIQLLLQWDKELVTLTTSENNKYVNFTMILWHVKMWWIWLIRR